MYGQVGLFVTIEVERTQHDWTFNRLFEDAGGHGFTPPLHLARQPGVY
jgi:hypothetical protein